MTSKTGTLTTFLIIILLCNFLINSASSIIDNNYQEKSPWILYEDNLAYWSVKGGGTGNINASISASTATVKTGESSMQINITTGPYMYVQVSHDYGENHNWSQYENLVFWIYGSNSNKTLEIALAAPDNENQYWQMFPDNFTGWTQIVIPIQSMEKIGNPNLSTIRIIAFFFFTAQSNFYIDHLLLDTTQQTTTPTTQPTTSPNQTPTQPPTSPQTTPNPQKTPDWLSENWRWIILLTAIIVIIGTQIVIQTTRKKRRNLHT